MFVPAVLNCRTASSSSPRRPRPVSHPLGVPVDISSNVRCGVDFPAFLTCRTSSSSSPRRRPPVSYPLGIPAAPSDENSEVDDFPPVAAVLTLPGLIGAPGSRAGTAGSGAARAATAGTRAFRLGSPSHRSGASDSPEGSYRSLPSSARTLSKFFAPKQKAAHHLKSDSSTSSIRPPYFLNSDSSTSSLHPPYVLDASTNSGLNSKPFMFGTPMDSALSHVQEAAGRNLHTLHIADIRHSCNLQSELAQLRLHDYFDERGGRRLRRLGFTVAAKQYAHIKGTFGSSTEEDKVGIAERKNISARSFFSATQALMKDMSASEKRKQEHIDSIDEADKVQTEDVQQRQLEMFFLEVPDFKRYVPLEVQLNDLLPAYVDRETEIRERRTQEKVASHFNDVRWVEGSRMGWMMTQDEVLLLADLASRWSKAARHANCPIGMDRSTFCRFILDLGLVDQKKVPFYWAVSLFDAGAQPMKCCPLDATWASSAPAAMMVNRWTLMSILDKLLRQHFDFQSKGYFFVKLKDIARQRLPRHLLEGLFDESNGPQSRTRPSFDGATASDCSSRDVSPNPDTATRVKRVLACHSGKSEEQRRGTLAAPGKRRNSINRAPASSPSSRKGGEHGRKKAAQSKDPPREPVHQVHVQHDNAKQHEVPPWLLSPEVAASNVDTKFESLARDRLHAAMLLEPEVLHLVVQHHVLFYRMHKLYADSEGHLSFPAMLQFTTDFQLTPQLVPADILKTTYESSQCLQPRSDQEQEGRDAHESIAAETGPLSAAGERKFSKAPTNSASVSKQPLQEELPRSHDLKDLKKRVILKNKACNIICAGSKMQETFDKSVFENIEDSLKEEERHSASHNSKPVPSMFGVAALMETLCKLAFVRLGCYGNAAQKNSSAYARVVWMITYLRFVFEHLRNSAERHTSQGRPDPIQGTLKHVLGLSLDTWTTPRKHGVLASRDHQLLPTYLQPLPGAGVPKKGRKSNLSDAKKHRGRGVTLQPSSDHWSQVRTAIIAVDFTRKLRHAAEKRREQNQSSETTEDMANMKEDAESERNEDPKHEIQGSDGSSSGEDVEEDPYAVKKTGNNIRAFSVNPFQYSAVQQGRRLSSGMPALDKNAKVAEKQDKAVLTLEDLFATEAGEPSISDGLCRVCGRKAGIDCWGNPRCRGCSVVDSLAFQFHPFQFLLQVSRRAPKVELAPVVAELPPIMPRCSVTPPLLGSLGQRYRDEFGYFW